jgi:hypothetical protein
VPPIVAEFKNPFDPPGLPSYPTLLVLAELLDFPVAPNMPLLL